MYTLRFLCLLILLKPEPSSNIEIRVPAPAPVSALSAAARYHLAFTDLSGKDIGYLALSLNTSLTDRQYLGVTREIKHALILTVHAEKGVGKVSVVFKV